MTKIIDIFDVYNHICDYTQVVEVKRCIFCNRANHLKMLKGKIVCTSCLNGLKNLEVE
jgi:hypothetical protein